MFKFPLAFILFPSIFAWAIGWVINSRIQEVNHIPHKNAAKASFMTVLSQITLNTAIYLIDYPTAIMFKSCTIVAVLLVAFCCSTIKSKNLKIGPQKIITGLLVTIGIIMYSSFRKPDPVLRDPVGNDMI